MSIHFKFWHWNDPKKHYFLNFYSIINYSLPSSAMISLFGFNFQMEENRTQLVELIGYAPLSELKGYSTYLRTITSGRAFLGMELSHYSHMSDEQQRAAIEDVTGFKPNY